MSVRLGPWQKELLSAEADREGVALSQFMRDAAFARAIYMLARRDDADTGVWLRLVEMLQRGEPHPDDVEELIAAVLAPPQPE